MTPPVVVQAGIPALGTMLVIAGLALVLGLIALRLSRRHTHREAAARDAGPPLDPGAPHDPGAPRDPGAPGDPAVRRDPGAPPDPGAAG